MNWKRLFGNKDAEIDEEIESHLKMAIRDRIERGESPEKARQAALRELGGATVVKQTTREVWRWVPLDEAWQDLRFGLRILTQSPFFAAAAITLIAVGIGGNTAIFSMVSTFLVKPMPGVQADNLVSLGLTVDGRIDDPSNSYPNYLDYAAQTKTLRSVVARGFERFTLALEKETYGVWGGLVTSNYFDTLGVQFAKGRSFSADESSTNASGLLAVISHSAWQNYFQGTQDVLGRTITLNGHAATIVGVAPPGYRGEQMAERDQVWVPLLAYSHLHGKEKDLADRSVGTVEMLGQLAPGVSLSAARAEFDAISTRLETAYPAANKRKAVYLERYSAVGAGGTPAKMFMRLFLAVAMLTMLAVCANVANLLLSRAAFRQREMAVRQSVGASRGRIFRMLLAEGLVLSFTAFGAAWLFTLWAANALPRFIPEGDGRSVDFSPDWRVAAYGLTLAVFSTVSVAIAPALRAWRQDLVSSLKAGQQGMTQGGSRLSSLLVVTQIALCVVLLTAAGLAYRSKFLLETFDFHFAKDHLLLVDVNTVGSAAGKEQLVIVLEHVRERLSAIPGVQIASYARIPPLRGSATVGPVRGDMPNSVSTEGNFVGPNYLRTLGVTPLLGRDLSEEDRPGGKKTAVINQSLAEALWPGQSALGHTVFWGTKKQAAEVVGVVPNAVFSNLRQWPRRNFLFLPARQNPSDPGSMTFTVKYVGRTEAIAPSIRAAVRQADPRLPVFSIRTMEAEIENITGPTLMITVLLSLFGGGALVLAGLGLYAVVAFNMSKRTRDFGIRIALGASTGQVLQTVLREGLIFTAIGLVIGFGLSLVVGKTLGSFLFGVTAIDKPTLLGVFVVLASVALLASYLPARRAARIDPMQALRNG